MIIRYSTSIKGVRYYEVMDQDDQIFVGTLGECKRFISIHNEKLLTRMAMDRAARAS